MSIIRRSSSPALLTALIATVLVVGGTVTPRADTTRCNGSAALCARSVGDVAFATTHNSMAATAYRMVPPNQRRSILSQLRHGIRGFQIDAYAGTADGRLVYTDLSGRFGDGSDIPPAAFAKGERLHRALGAPPVGTPTDVYLCHVFCELGAVRAVDTFRDMRAFLETHPDDVIVLVIEDYVTPERIRAEMDRAGLGPMLLAVAPGEPLPTLGEMVRSGTRVLASLENGDGGDTLPNAFARLVEETPYNFRNDAALADAASCAPNRGIDHGAVFQFNHWVTPASPVAARRVNARPVLQARIRRCTAQRGRGPTLVAVDFAERGDVLQVVDALNRAGPAR